MNLITEHYQRQGDLLIASGESITRTDQPGDIDGFVRSLRNFGALFYYIQKTDARLLPPAKQLNFLTDLLNKGHHVNDMYVQKKMMKEHEQILGMDLSYLVEYAGYLADREEKELGLMWREADKAFLEAYTKDLTGYFDQVDDNLVYRDLLAFTKKMVKKTIKKLDKLDRSIRLSSVYPMRSKLTDILVFLDVLNTHDYREEISEASLFLDVWHDRMVALKLITHYQEEYPKQAKQYTGTMEILRDYLDQKVRILPE